MPRKRLEDLYVVGKEVTIDDGTDSVTVWLQKLSPVELNSAMRTANAVRARVLSIRNDRKSDEFMALWLAVLEWDSIDALVTYLGTEQSMRVRDRCEAKLAAEDEWSKDNYLQGLRDSWDEGLSNTYLLDPEDADAIRVLGELTRFANQVDEDAQPELDDLRVAYEAKDKSILQEEALDRTIAYRANAGWLDEFHKSELFFGVRDPDNHKVRYFTKREEIDQLSLQVLSRLLEEYSFMSVDVVEGKGSAVTPTSSGSSEPLLGAGQPASSGQVVVNP